MGESYWTGFWGGWGNVEGIAGRLNQRARGGWRLVSTKSTLAFYFWIIPRPKLLMLYERDLPDAALSAPGQETPQTIGESSAR
jgi:hypothetical protein